MHPQILFAAAAASLFLAAPSPGAGQDPSGSLSGDGQFTIAWEVTRLSRGASPRTKSCNTSI